MFERYTEQARRALFFARYEVSELGGLAICTEHLLLGLLREPVGVSPDDIREEVYARLKRGEKVATSVEIPFAADAKKALDGAAREADRLLHNYIGPEHLLLALLGDEQSTAGAILTGRALRLDDLRGSIVKLLEEHGPTIALEALDTSERIDRIQHLVAHLAEMATSNPEAQALANRIRFLLDDLRGRSPHQP